MTIRSFRCKDTKALYAGGKVGKFANVRSTAERKLQLLDSAASLDFLRTPPGNHLEALGADRKGQYSIRINNQFRICFVWTSAGPEDVEIVDYH
ncbi:type II toxin-antitoxin system RelE/ParE family toxin [Rugamonas sp. DEMB1]|jgi:proteic killer suppression protein|uniref:type II toxin-antitoxin system RelE/ParE family toxin n=1 Tax=Rugamonas sp. DEMB1 TaxID=3039386 RepID=UPI00244D29E9|nr:type II toxin-antitoxin system RelE/ParE family toxin [Rugamonas sp. DEMB1]WGG48553.1 type II toxin-antitoxin system RelE/ParE family toxin [Rugamonas sp. DEMB1]